MERVDLIELIDGCMLGDGSLVLCSKSCWRNARFSFNNAYSLTLLEWIAKQLELWGLKARIEKCAVGTSRQSLVSRLDPFFTAMWRRWYDKSKSKYKRVPVDVRLDPFSLTLWFIADGTIGNDKRGWGKSEVEFSSQWVESDALFLKDRLYEEYGFKVSLIHRPQFRNDCYSLRLSRSSLNDFFNVIGGCPEWAPEMKYKWDKYYSNPRNFRR